MRDVAARRSLGANFKAGLAVSALGPTLDMYLFSRPWNVAFDRIIVPARIWIGSADRNVPLAAVDELLRKLPAIELIRIADSGHFWVTRNYRPVLSWIAASASIP